MSLNDLLLGSGDAAKQAAEETSAPKKKTNYLRLKSGESAKGFLLSTDFPVVLIHNDWEKRIHSHFCSSPKDKKGCLSCKHDVPAARTWLVPFYTDGEVKIIELKKKYVQAIYNFISEYEDEALTTLVTFSKSGSGTGVSYSILPARVKKGEEVERPDVQIDNTFWESVVQPLGDEYHKELLGLNGVKEADIMAIDDNGEGLTKLF
jgi:hypothetical protein